jgi:hypothetical protein
MLSFVAPTGAQSAGYDQYESDPANPVPFLGVHDNGMKPDYMALDQRFAAQRPDVLVYQTEALTEDVTIAGPPRPVLFVSTTGTDSDWIVKLIDVYPDSAAGVRQESRDRLGFEELVRGDVMRGKFRNSYSRPEPFVPNKVERVAFGMDDVLHTFKKGHRIMVQVQSSWFPLIDRNPQTYVPNIYEATQADFKSATQSIYRSGAHASYLTLPVNNRNDDKVAGAGY